MSGTAPPRFSLVVPTRDRPEFLRYCLAGIAAQRYTDFEVIVCDNHTGQSSRAVFDEVADERFTYLVPDAPLAMPDNWELACERARGDVVCVVVDKTVLQPAALEVAALAFDTEPVDMVTWWNEGYDLVDEARSVGPGRYRAGAHPVPPELYDAREELARRSSFRVPRTEEGLRYVRGKICFGGFSRSLLARMRGLTSRLFFPVAPDYTSMVTAAAAGAVGIDLGRPLLMSFNSVTSNGRQYAVDPRYAFRAIGEADPSGEVMASLPIPGVYASLHNVVASDYVRTAARCVGIELPDVDLVNLAARAREDLARVRWPSDDERADQYGRLEEFERGVGVPSDAASPSAPSLRSRTISMLGRVPVVERVAMRVLGRPTLDRYDDILAAISAADACYANVTEWGPGRTSR